MDDTTKINNRNAVADCITENFSYGLTKWEQASKIITGILNLKNYGYYILQWQYNRKGYLEMCNSEDESVTMETEEGNNSITVNNFNKTNEYKYLEVMTAPN